MAGFLQNLEGRAAPYYRVLFVPYVLVFFLYILYTVLVGATFAVFGWGSAGAASILAILILGAIFTYVTRVLIRRLICYLARRKSPNPKIVIKTRETTLRFLESDIVEYSIQETIRFKSRRVREKRLYLSWTGPLTSISVIEQHGCVVELTKSKMSHATTVLARFDQDILNNCDFKYRWTLRFNDPGHTIGEFIRIIAPYLPEDGFTFTVILRDGQAKQFVDRVFRAANQHRPIKEVYSEFDMTSHSNPINRPVQGLSYYTGTVD